MKICDRCKSEKDVKTVEVTVGFKPRTDTVKTEKKDMCDSCAVELVKMTNLFLENKLKLCRCDTEFTECKE